MQIHRALFVTAALAFSAGVGPSTFTLAAQTVSTPVLNPAAAPQALRVRFHRLRLSTLRSHTGGERGLWLRGLLLADDYTRREALVQYLRADVLPYLAAERTVLYPVADIVLGGSHEFTSAAVGDSRVIERFVDRLEVATRSADALGFQDNAEALRVVLDNYFARDRRLIQQVLALGPRAGPRRVVIADRGALTSAGSERGAGKASEGRVRS